MTAIEAPYTRQLRCASPEDMERGTIAEHARPSRCKKAVAGSRTRAGVPCTIFLSSLDAYFGCSPECERVVKGQPKCTASLLPTTLLTPTWSYRDSVKARLEGNYHPSLATPTLLAPHAVNGDRLARCPRRPLARLAREQGHAQKKTLACKQVITPAFPSSPTLASRPCTRHDSDDEATTTTAARPAV